MDVLENCSHSEIRDAWATYQKTGPRTASGRLVKPDAGALYQTILRSRPKPVAVPRPEEPRPERVSPERARELLEQAGFKVNRFGGVGDA